MSGWHRHITSGVVCRETYCPKFNITPVVVLAPEDEADVERLAAAWWATLYRHLPWKGGGAGNARIQVMNRAREALASMVKPPLVEVYEHLLVSTLSDGTMTARCGKVWRSLPSDEVKVVGRCDNCARLSLQETWRA